jgi:hypothetical protein
VSLVSRIEHQRSRQVFHEQILDVCLPLRQEILLSLSPLSPDFAGLVHACKEALEHPDNEGGLLEALEKPVQEIDDTIAGVLARLQHRSGRSGISAHRSIKR